jgi:uncharacterized protein YaaN involved in tellurite resistance
MNETISSANGSITSGSTATSELPLPATGITAYRTATGTELAKIERALAEIDINDSNSILFFGTAAQGEVTTVADEMLEGVRNKDTGPAGQALSEMVTTLRGFPVEELDPNRKRGLLARLLGKARPIVRGHIDKISNRLDDHTSELMKDIGMLDRLYDKTLAYFHTLAVYIAAGEESLRRLDEVTLPALARDAESSGEMLKAQALRDMRAKRDDLERRVHDLKLTRQVTMQSLPSIRLVQENDKALVSKIGSTMANTIPLWRQQLAMAVTIARSAEAGNTLKQASDLTNELLTSNAEALRTSSATIRTQIERGVVDIASVKQANDALIATIDDALRIADEGRRQRVEAEKQLITCEMELKQTLRAAQARSPQQAG